MRVCSSLAVVVVVVVAVVVVVVVVVAVSGMATALWWSVPCQGVCVLAVTRLSAQLG